MTDRTRIVFGCLIGAGAVAVVAVLRFGLEPVLEGAAPLMLFLIAAAAAGIYGGLTPAVVAAGMGAAVGVYFFVEPNHAFGPIGAADQMRLLIYTVTAVAVGLVTDREYRARTSLEARFRQQEALNELSREALATGGVQQILDAAVRLIAAHLKVEFVKILELLPDRQELLVKAGVGWREGVVGHAAVPADQRSQAGYALAHRWVIVENLQGDKRFGPAELLRGHGVRSGVSTDIVVEGRIYGVLGAHTAKRRKFTLSDLEFLQGVANLIGHTIERSRRIESAQQMLNRLNTLVRANIIGVVIASADGRVQEANDAFLEMTGYTRQDLDAGRINWLKMSSPEWVQATEANLEQLLTTGRTLPAEREWLRKDGRRISVLLGLAKVPEEDEIVGFCLDLSPRKELQRSLAESEERYRQLTEAAVEGVAIHDDRRIWDCNDNFARLFGYEVQEIIGKHPDDFVVPEHRRYLKDESGSPVEVHGQRKDGTTIPIEIRSKSIRYRGSPMKVRIVLDIGLRKQAENLRRSKEELEIFAYAASHDLQEPLRNLRTYSHLLKRSLQRSDYAEAEKIASELDENSTRMSRLVADLLSYALVGSGGPLSPAPVSMEAVVAWTIMNLDAAIRESGAMVTHEPIPEIVADQNLMTMLMQNLVGNAIKYRKDEAPRIHVSASRENSDWLFSVRDNGRGFDPKYAEQVFKPFQRLNGREVPGTGLGLAICKKIVEQHGGQIWAESEPGQGSTFRFRLPVRE